MRKIALTALAGLLINGTLHAQAEKKTVKENGKMVTHDVAVQPFTELKASGVYELKLLQGDREGVRIEADENLQEYITVRNDGSSLVIDTKKMSDKNITLKHKTKTRVYVTFKKLNELQLSTVGNVSGDTQLSFDNLTLQSGGVGNIDLKITARKISLQNKSVGNVTLSGKAENAVMLNNGVGNIHAGNLVVQTMSIDNSGVGSAEVNAEKELNITDNWMGKVKNRGAAPIRKMDRIVI